MTYVERELLHVADLSVGYDAVSMFALSPETRVGTRLALIDSFGRSGEGVVCGVDSSRMLFVVTFGPALERGGLQESASLVESACDDGDN